MRTAGRNFAVLCRDFLSWRSAHLDEYKQRWQDKIYVVEPFDNSAVPSGRSGRRCHFCTGRQPPTLPSSGGAAGSSTHPLRSRQLVRASLNDTRFTISPDGKDGLARANSLLWSVLREPHTWRHPSRLPSMSACTSRSNPSRITRDRGHQESPGRFCLSLSGTNSTQPETELGRMGDPARSERQLVRSSEEDTRRMGGSIAPEEISTSSPPKPSLNPLYDKPYE